MAAAERVAQLVVSGLPSDFPELGTEDPVALAAKYDPLSLPGYEVRELLSDRDHDELWRAYQPSVGREVAIRILSGELASDPAFIRKFEAVARTVARLTHPHVVPLIDFWRGTESAYLVMGLVPSGTLGDLMRTGEINPETSIAILQQVGSALDVFFVGSAAADGRVNVSPKGKDSLRVLDPTALLWLNLTGSGNETAAHLRELNRITLMWCAFEGPPRILRVYGTAAVVHPRDPAWAECEAMLPTVPGARQYFRVAIDLVQTSCGYAVPMMTWTADRTALTKWSEKRGPEGLEQYWRDRNTASLDGFETGILG
jgi:hypothetical protein